MKINIFASNFYYEKFNISNVYVSCKNGDMNIFPAHEHTISSLKDGIVIVNINNDIKDKIFLTQGLVQIKQSHVNIFSDNAIKITEDKSNLLKKNLLHLEKQINVLSKKKDYCSSLEYNFLKKNKAFYELALINLNR